MSSGIQYSDLSLLMPGREIPSELLAGLTRAPAVPVLPGEAPSGWAAVCAAPQLSRDEEDDDDLDDEDDDYDDEDDDYDDDDDDFDDDDDDFEDEDDDDDLDDDDD